MFCKNCGNKLESENKFCVGCGQEHKLGWFVVQKSKFIEWIRGHKKGLLISVGIIILIFIGSSSGKNHQSNSSPTPDVSYQNTINETYGQLENASAVVNILCPSMVSDEESSGGSGTIISDDGIILTNSHIIPQDNNDLHVDKNGCLVVLSDALGQAKDYYLAHPIVLKGISDKYDLAFMEIYSAYYDTDKQEYDGVYPRKFPTYKCENDNPKLGDAIRVFGYPSISGGYSLTITDGVVSSLSSDGLIYTSAKISHGNSGGLAVDKNGCMIGVPSMVSTDENESLGIIYSMDLVNEFSDKVSNNIEQ